MVIDSETDSSGPCYDTNVLARTLSWLYHNNPHWPMQSYEAVVPGAGVLRADVSAYLRAEGGGGARGGGGRPRGDGEKREQKR
ncbi:hypothetical protein [Nocardia abscessus]|uniref:hypothetical protein n=1 Tax=Nocardia abscessus TaxID=120957 RepID=UPI0024571F98|nr:hypothetical protein [Nocardia abscessus]